MFGYLLPYKPEMKVREFECYRAVYCGLCKQLSKDYGFLPRMFLNYDMLLLTLLADGLSGEQGNPVMQRCIANPKKRCMLSDTFGLQLGADCTILASWYKLLDDKEDESWAKGTAASTAEHLLKKAFLKASTRHPEIDRVMQTATKQQQLLEQQNSKSYDQAADPTAQMTAAMFQACSNDPVQQQILFRMGLFLGKIIYYLDAAEDYTKDKEKQRYNVFLNNGLSFEQTVETAKQQCAMAAAEAARCYNQLHLKLNQPIWDNILYLGIPQAIKNAGNPRIPMKKHPH